MKPKSLSKKLNLNKKTITHLNRSEMMVKGGMPPITYTCYYTMCGCPTDWRLTCVTHCNNSCPCETGVEDRP